MLYMLAVAVAISGAITLLVYLSDCPWHPLPPRDLEDTWTDTLERWDAIYTPPYGPPADLGRVSWKRNTRRS